ncbi:MAG: serine/threonine-protein kinase [Humibacillus sp.]
MNESPRPEVPGYRLERVIGAGASGTVWAARDAMGRPVAVKVAHEAAWFADEEGELASRTEQHVLLAVRHDHLVALRDVVPLTDGRLALVFNLVTGALLGGTVRARGHLRPGEVVTVITPLCEAVATLHAAAGLHGDISPSNVMVTAEGKPLLLDLGAARLAGAPVDTPVHGTTGFVAPEVREGLVAGEASDVFALGALAWFCLTGNGAPDTVLRLDPETVLSHVGPELADLVGACIDPDPARRPRSAGLARLFFDAAAPEPIEVVVGADEASALTHRLRAEARADGSSGDRPPTRADGRSGSQRAAAPTGRHGRLVAAARSWLTRCRFILAAGLPPRAGVRASLVTLALLLVTGLLAGLGFALSARSDAATTSASRTGPTSRVDGLEATSTPRTTPRTTSSTTPRTTPTRARSPMPAPPLTTPSTTASPRAATTSVGPGPVSTAQTVDDLIRRSDAPSLAPEALLQALSDRRAVALTTRDVGGLALVDATASAALTSDAALVADLESAGHRWEGLRLEVAQVAVVTASSTQAVLRARVDWTAYVLVTGSGRLQQPAATGEVLDFTLTRGARGWRVVSISPPAT